MGLGYTMLAQILALYSHPIAQIKVNGHLSRPLGISNGTRQGCPLSPLLFTITMEPFLLTIRGHPDILGLSLPTLHSQKIAAYADSLLFFITRPHVTLPNLLKAFDECGKLSNLKINLQKSEALNVSLSQLEV